MQTNEIPANQQALAQTFRALSRGKSRSLTVHLEDAFEVMKHLRSQGFRVVPFPPLKRAKDAAKKAQKIGGRFKIAVA